MTTQVFCCCCCCQSMATHPSLNKQTKICYKVDPSPTIISPNCMLVQEIYSFYFCLTKLWPFDGLQYLLYVLLIKMIFCSQLYGTFSILFYELSCPIVCWCKNYIHLIFVSRSCLPCCGLLTAFCTYQGQACQRDVRTKETDDLISLHSAIQSLIHTSSIVWQSIPTLHTQCNCFWNFEKKLLKTMQYFFN